MVGLCFVSFFFQVRIYSSLRNMYHVPRKQVTVLSQYKAQCSDIKSNLQDLGMENPQVSTIVASQGSYTCIELIIFAV